MAFILLSWRVIYFSSILKVYIFMITNPMPIYSILIEINGFSLTPIIFLVRFMAFSHGHRYLFPMPFYLQFPIGFFDGFDVIIFLDFVFFSPAHDIEILIKTIIINLQNKIILIKDEFKHCFGYINQIITILKSRS